ncbi:deleted in malignant brain tumors 1 protein-like [Heptranchias perlo]|uniref:deleted in malignant brain tumors 1 protein-like n=1 Tax=Heptranchias perlo TaxID=212740 RepID=UPI0035594C54
MNNAEVVCRQIGCGEAVATLSVAHFGPGTGEIVLDDIKCQGDEQYLWNCPNNGWLSHNCQHIEDVAVNCSAALETQSSTVHLSCSTNYLEAVVNKSDLYLLGYTENDVFLNDPSCRPVISGQNVTFTIPLNSCGTMQQEINGNIIYSNTIRLSPSESVIAHQITLQINIGCEMQQDTVIKVMYWTEDDITWNKPNSSKFDIRMAFYDSASFTSPVLVSPYYVYLSQELFLQVSLHSSDTDLVVFVDTCTASRYSFDWTYDLIKNG